MVFVAAGIRRSASTLVFQIACELAGGDKHRIRRWDDRPPNIYEDDKWWVAKSHKFIPELIPNYEKKRAWSLVTIRDPRDIAVSMMELKGMTFDEVMEWGAITRDINHQKRWADAGFSMYRYEDFVDDISILAWDIAIMMNRAVEHEDIEYLTEEFSFAKNKSRSDKQGNVAADLLFPGHLQTGEVGRWKRVLTDKQANEIRHEIGNGWFRRWGYKQRDA